MCGIAGLFHPDRAETVDAKLLRRMTAALAHRGPDGDGFHLEPGIGLGHSRLAIIDPDDGQQPMANEDGSVVMVFNGMIYNFQDLRPKLQALGHVFRTRCDTETIIHAWESWGPDCLDHLSGMFAFAIWDRNHETLFLARDRLGKKPLYHAVLPDGWLAFGSEMAALLAISSLSRHLSTQAVEDFLAYGYVPDPETIYRHVQRLPAAHCLSLRRGSDMPSPRRYWHPPVTTRSIGEQDAITELRALLGAATQKRLVSDVPLGAFLSGGVDSSAVVATAARMRAEPLQTFTIGFDGAEDETPFAAAIARRYGTVQHNERAAGFDMLEAAAEQARIFGEPFSDASSVPTFHVCRLARLHAKVAISGDGGDEVFAGYRRYRFHMLAEAARAWLPPALRRHAIGTLARFYPKLDRAPRWLRARHSLTELSLDSALGYARTVARMQDQQRRWLFSQQTLVSLDGHDPWSRIVAAMDRSGAGDPLLQVQHADLATWLPGGILTKVDRASMANSLEVRAPLLDQRIVEWGLSLPTALKLRVGEGKYVLKRALEPLLPIEILYRGKQGFAVSLAELFRREQARLRARLLTPAVLDAGFFSPSSMRRLVDEHVSGRFDHSTALWLLLVFAGFLAWDATVG